MAPVEFSDEQRRDWLRLIQSENIGPTTFYKLINRFGSALQALEALPELSRRGGLRRPIRLYSKAAAERDLAEAEAIGARFYACGENGYPPLLRHIESPPPLLCIKGRNALADTPCLAIVGSRNASAAGMKLARQFATAIGRAGYTVVSGLARGIDAAAHAGALSSGTIAVLANGIDVVYPPQNRALQEKIAEDGLLISERPPGSRPRADNFPQRNRLISGISLGVLVVEAALRSGSLITARYAGEQGREVFALPGSPLDPRAGGANRLIRDGAHLVTQSEDIVEILERLGRSGSFIDDTLEETDDDTATVSFPAGEIPDDLRERVIALLSPAPVSVNDLIRAADAPAAVVIAILLELEVAGRVYAHSRERVSLIG